MKLWDHLDIQYIERIELHMLIVAEVHMHNGQIHQQPQNADAVFVSIYCIPRLSVLFRFCNW